MAVLLRIIGLIISWGPLVISSVRKVEVLFSGKTGPEKKEAAVGLIEDALSVKGIELTSQNLSIISGFIDFVVAALNAWKQWKSSKS